MVTAPTVGSPSTTAVYAAALICFLSVNVALPDKIAFNSLSKPPQPHFPTKFAAHWVSDYQKGIGFYALDKHREKIIFQDGTADHLCSSYYNHTSCVQLTTQGYRYLIFPEKDDCCKCCTYTRGSYLCGGPLSSSWVSNKTGNLQYLGVEDVRGKKCHKWNAHGFYDPNFYFEFVSSGLPCEIDVFNYLRNPSQRSDNQYIFMEETVTEEYDSHKMFKVPAMCKDSEYCGGKVCAHGPENPAFRKVIN